MKKGFTLIELLVVVLIIGILSAVALPQYTKAVEKSRLSEAKIIIRSLIHAEEAYGLATGEVSCDLEALDISLSGEYLDRGGCLGKKDAVQTKNFVYFFDEASCNSSNPSNNGACSLICAEREGKDYQICGGGSSYDSTEIAAGAFWCNGEEDVCKEAGAVKGSDNFYYFN